MTSATPTLRPREYLSLSTLMNFVRCPRKYFYSKCGITSDATPTALIYGTAMHRAVSVAVMEGFEPAYAAFCSVWDESLADEKRSLKRAHNQLEYFALTHKDNKSLYRFLPPPPSPVELSDDVSPWEIPFVLDIGLPVPLAGRLDGWVRHRDTGDHYAYEFKTASRVTASLFDSLELNPQILTYALVVRSLTGKPIRGVMFEAMLIDQRKVENITHPVDIQPHMLEDALVWLRYFGGLLLQCEEWALKHPENQAAGFPKNFGGCSAYPQFYMPGSQCEFANLCRMSDWKTMLPYYTIAPEHKLVELTVPPKEPKP